jgi:hypothetical protein
MAGLALVLVSVFFQRRGLMEWTELVFLGVCIGLQETFLRLPSLRRWRTPMLVAYSLAPLILIIAHADLIRQYAGQLVELVLLTPLPLVLVSVQFMVLYVRDAPRLVSVVLVLALFSAVIGVRRDDVSDAVWPWLGAIAGLAAIYLALQHPGMLYYGVYTRRALHMLPAARPGGILRRSFLMLVPLLACSAVLASFALYFSAPRLDLRGSGAGELFGDTVQVDPPGGGNPGTPDTSGSRSGPGPTPEPPSVAGLSDGVTLGEFGEILKTNSPALEVKPLYPPEQAPPTLYLRAFTYAGFDGERWLPLPGDAARMRDVGSRRYRSLPSPQGDPTMNYVDRLYELSILESGLGEGGMVPLPVEANRIHDFNGPLMYDTAEHTLLAPTMRQGDQFVVQAHELASTRSQLEQKLAQRLPIGTGLTAYEYYTAIPSDLREQVIARFTGFQEELVQRLYGRNARSREDAGVYATANSIVSIFAKTKVNGAPAWSYSLDARPKPGRDAIVRFLDLRTREAERFGHCEYFATGMCVLLRCLDIPCRLAAGFAVREADIDGVWRVTTSHAHAWVEVYFVDLGWVAFDPTPPAQAESNSTAPETPEESPPDETQPDQPDQPDPSVNAETEPRDWFRDYNAGDQRELFAEMLDELKSGLTRVDEVLLALTKWLPDEWFPRSGWVRAVILLLPINTLLLLLALRRRKRRKMEKGVLKGMGAGDRRRERGQYFQLLLLLARYGYHKRPSETPREFARRVMLRGGDELGQVGELTELYYALRFGANRGLADQFKRALQDYAERLRSVMPHSVAETDAGTAPTP